MLQLKPPQKNCLSCSKYLDCKDSAKSVLFVCKRYSETKYSLKDAKMKLFDFTGIDMEQDQSTQLYIPKHDISTYKSDFDIMRMLEEEMQSDSMVSSDIRINDRDFKQAPNFYRWCVDDNYLKQKPYLEQAIIGLRVFAEFCPRCSDMEWFDHTHKVTDSLAKLERKVCMLEHGVCPNCKVKRTKLFRKGELNYYNEAAIVAGQRSGKSAWLGMAASYLTHMLIKMQKPNEIYGFMHANILHGTFVALTYAQAKDTLWEPYYGHLVDSPWFRSYHDFLTHRGDQLGEQLFNLKDTFVLYRHRRIFVYPAGPDKRTLRGRTRAFGCLDGESLVSTNKGLVAIKNDLYGNRTHVGENHFKVSEWVYTGVKPCFRVTTETGHYIECTANHELKTDRNWVRTDNITYEDKLCISLGGAFPRELTLNFNPTYEPLFAPMIREIERLGTFDIADLRGFGRSVTPITSKLRRSGKIERHYRSGKMYAGFSRCYYTTCAGFNAEEVINSIPTKYGRDAVSFPAKMTPELATLLGYYVADGSYNEDASEFYFASGVSKRLRHFLSCFVTVFGIEPSTTTYVTKEGRKMTRYAIAYANVKSFLRYLGLDGVTSERKQIPWSVLQADKDSVVAFLRAAYDCDGGVARRSIYYDTVSPVLAHQVQVMLQRFGVLASVSVRTYKNDVRKNDVLRVAIQFDKYQKRFANRIGFSTNALELPVARPCPYVERNSIVLVPVSEVRSLGKRKVYDITVDDEDHGFTANGIVVHNSIDELGWFDNSQNSSKVKMNANEVYIALQRSLLSVRAAAEGLVERGFHNVPTGYFLNISSPSSIRDKIMELVAKSQGSTKLYGLIRPTWMMNPRVPRSALDEEFRNDPVAAMRDYGCEPPLTSNPFISSSDAVLQCCSGKKNPIVLQHKQKKRKDGTSSRYASVVKIGFGGKASVLAIDAGYSNNSFGCAVAHKDANGYPRISLLAEIMPLPGIPLNYTLIYNEVLSTIIEERNIQLLAADRWNSLKVLSDAEAEFGISTRQYSLKYSDMQTFKTYVLDNLLSYPSSKEDLDSILTYDQSDYPRCFQGRTTEHFLLQLLTVQDTGSGVIKGDQLTDDLARAAMLAVCMVLDPVNEELFAAPEVVVEKLTQLLGVFRGGSGGGSSRSSAGSSLGSSALGLKKSCK